MSNRVSSITGTGVVPPETHQQRAHGPFQLRRIRPGVTLGQPGDPGFGGLGTIDHAKLQPGLIVGMHEHRNDEIISYMRAGQMRHTDSAGHSEVLSSNRLMVMNAGNGFSHEEAVVGREQIEMLQIFVRPQFADMTPEVQFVELDEVDRGGKWRLLTGPAGSAAPTFVRQQVYLYDAHLAAGEIIDFPFRYGFDRWFYVFDGAVSVNELNVDKYTGLMIGGGNQEAKVTALTGADIVTFLVDRTAGYSRDGTLSG